MSRGDPQKIYQAQRRGVFMPLRDAERVNELDAEHWIARWERHAEVEGPARGSTGYWDAARVWITEERRPAEILQGRVGITSVTTCSL